MGLVCVFGGLGWQMTSLMLREMSLGDSPPVLTGMKFLNTPAANEVLLECGVAWAAGKNAFAALQVLARLWSPRVRVPRKCRAPKRTPPGPVL